MDFNRLTVGKMAQLNNISEQTLRLYSKMGLLCPNYTDAETGYRYYSISQSALLDVIQYYKAMGIPLKDIKNKIEKINQVNMLEMLKERYDYLETEIERLKICQDAIEKSINNYHRYVTLPKSSEIFLEYIPEREICVYKTGHNFFDYDYNQYEYNLRMLKKYLLEVNFPTPYFCNIGTLIRNEHLQADDLFCDEMFIFIERNYNNLLTTEKIPAGTYLSMCGNVFSDEKLLAKKLLEEIARKNYDILGDYYCEVVSTLVNADHPDNSLFYKLQVRIM